MAYEKLKQEQYQNFGGINVKESKYQTGELKFLDLRNYTFERPGALTSRPGTEFWQTLAPSFLAKPTSTYQFTQNNGSSFILFDAGQTMYSLGSTFQAIDSPLTSSSTQSLPFDFESINNFAFYANQNIFDISDGTKSWNWAFNDFLTPVGPTFGATFNTSLGVGVTYTIASGTYIITWNPARGFSSIYEGPFFSFSAQFLSSTKGVSVSSNTSVVNSNIVTSVSATIVSQGQWLIYGFSLTQNFGISGIAPALVRVADGVTIFRHASPVSFYVTLVGGISYYHFNFQHLTTAISGLNLTRPGWSLGSPKFLELYNNQLIFSGITSVPSSFYYSRVTEPDVVDGTNFIEFNSGDGQEITGIQSFRESLLIFKSGRVAELSGLTEENFQLRELTNQYGLVNDRAKVVFENKCWFVDRSGIIEYDGANFRRVSEQIKTYFDQVDIFSITAFHVKDKRQVWFCASNTCFVFDYFVEAWTIYDRLPIDSSAGAQVLKFGATRTDVSFWRAGATNFEAVRFNTSLATDLGSGITLIAQTRYHKRLEQTTEELWRQLFINVDVPSATLAMTLQLIPNYGTSVYATRSVFLNEFQERVQFGVPARSMSVRFILQASEPIKFNGYTIESRFMRKV